MITIIQIAESNKSFDFTTQHYYYFSTMAQCIAGCIAILVAIVFYKIQVLSKKIEGLYLAIPNEYKLPPGVMDSNGENMHSDKLFNEKKYDKLMLYIEKSKIWHHDKELFKSIRSTKKHLIVLRLLTLVVVAIGMAIIYTSLINIKNTQSIINESKIIELQDMIQLYSFCFFSLNMLIIAISLKS